MKKRSWLLRFWQNCLIPFSITVVFFVLWQILSRGGILSQLLFPAPSSIFSYLRTSIIDGEIIAALSATLGRIGAGFLLGALPGLFLGWAMGWSSRLRKYIDPFVAAIYPIPKIAIFPLIMFIFGIGEISKVIAIAISAFFPLLINTIAGVRQINPVYLEVARNYGANRWKTLWNVILPGSLPMVLAGVRIALNTSLLIAIAVEMVAAEVGLGVMIWFAWQTLRIEQLYAALFVIAILGIGFNIVLEWASRRMAPWHTRTSQDEGS